jgi:hypothetical protein
MNRLYGYVISGCLFFLAFTFTTSMLLSLMG